MLKGMTFFFLLPSAVAGLTVWLTMKAQDRKLRRSLTTRFDNCGCFYCKK